jgi:hypothetical protein
VTFIDTIENHGPSLARRSLPSHVQGFEALLPTGGPQSGQKDGHE